jgi:hypothetical protein
MSSNNQLAVKTIGHHCEVYKANHKQLKSREAKINKLIKDNTQQEKQNVEDAIKALNLKINQIVESDEVKQEMGKMEQNHKSMMLSLQSVMSKFNHGRQLIMARKDIPLQKKKECIKTIFDKLLDKLYEPEDVKAFKQMFNNLIVVNPAMRGLQGTNQQLMIK